MMTALAANSAGLDVAPLAWALERMRPELLAPGALPGETLADVRTRRAAALDILDDLLAEYAQHAEAVAS